MYETWRGSFPLTHFIREAICRKASFAPDAKLTDEERTLLAACNFWFEVTTCQFALRKDKSRSIVAMMRAQDAFESIGALRVSSIIRGHLKALLPLRDSAQARRLLRDMEDRLARVEDNVDELVSEYATRQSRSCIDR